MAVDPTGYDPSMPDITSDQGLGAPGAGDVVDTIGDPSQLLNQILQRVLAGPPPPIQGAATPSPAPSAPSAPSASTKGGHAGLIPLMMMLPLAMKSGGLPAVAAVLRGVDQAQTEKQNLSARTQQLQFTQNRLTQGDARATALAQSLEQSRRDTASTQRLRAQQQFLSNAGTALTNPGLTSADAVDRLMSVLQPQADLYGIQSAQLQAMRPSQQKVLENGIRAALKATSPEAIAKMFEAGTPPTLHIDGVGDIPYEPTASQPIGWKAFYQGFTDPKTGHPVIGKPEKPAATKSYQRDNVLVDGMPTQVLIDPDPAAQFKVYDLNGQPIADPVRRVRPMPPSQILVNTANASAPAAPVLTQRPDPATANVVDKQTGLTPNTIYQGGMTFALTGAMPSLGRGTDNQMKAARNAIQNTGSALAAAAGTDIATLRAEYVGNRGTIQKMMPTAVMTASASGAAKDNLQLAIDQSAKVGRTTVPLANRYLQWAQGNLTPATGLTQLEIYIYTAAREYAKVVSGSAASTAGLTDSASREASHLLNAAMAPETLAAAANAMTSDMDNVVRNQQKALAGVSTSIANVFGAANGMGPISGAGAPSTPSAPVTTSDDYTRYLQRGRR